MNCGNCGAVFGENANFCANCGARVRFVATPTAQPVTGLLRLHEGRAIGGVCAGLSWYYGWDLALVRIVAVLLAVLACPVGIIAYIAAWMIIPEAPLYVVHPMPPPMPQAMQEHPQT